MIRHHLLTLAWTAVSAAFLPVALTGAIAPFLRGYEDAVPGLPFNHPLLLAAVNLTGFGIPSVLGLIAGLWFWSRLSREILVPEGSRLPIWLRAGSALSTLMAVFALLWTTLSIVMLGWFGQVPIVDMEVTPAILVLSAGGPLAGFCFLTIWGRGLWLLGRRLRRAEPPGGVS